MDLQIGRIAQGPLLEAPGGGFGALDAFRLAGLMLGAYGPRALALQDAIEQFPGTLRREAVRGFGQDRVPALAQSLHMAFGQS
jgi:hypothetical protein